MNDVTFRTAVEPEAEVKAEKPNLGPTTVKETKVEPAFTLYESANEGKTYIEDYFQIENRYDEIETESDDIKTINEYFKSKVEDGSIANSLEAVKHTLKKYEKAAEVDPADRLIVKVKKLVAYIQLKKSLDEISVNNRTYGTNKNRI